MALDAHRRVKSLKCVLIRCTAEAHRKPQSPTAGFSGDDLAWTTLSEGLVLSQRSGYVLQIQPLLCVKQLPLKRL